MNVVQVFKVDFHSNIDYLVKEFKNSYVDIINSKKKIVIRSNEHNKVLGVFPIDSFYCAELEEVNEE